MTTFDKVNDVDLGLVFEVGADGTIASSANHPWGPEVTHTEGKRHPEDIEVQAGRQGDVWQALHGYSGQYLYRGAVMHPSEYIGGRLEEDLLGEPGIYCVVEVRDDDGQFPEGDPIGWVVLRYAGHEDDCRYCAAGEPMQHTYERQVA